MKYPILLLFVVCCLLPHFGISQKAKSRSIDPQTKEIMIPVDGQNRKFIVHTPPSYNPKGNLYPVVFMFHGGGGSGEQFLKTSGWREVGDREGFITVFPTGLKTCVMKADGPQDRNSWMTTGKLANLCPGQAPHDDVKFVKVMLSYLNGKYSINQKKIYASGFSNGMGLILSQLMPNLSGRFAAFAGAGSLLQTSEGPVNGASPLFVMVGENDYRFFPPGENSIPISESDFEADTFMKSMQDNLLDMQQLDGTYQVRDRQKYLAYRFTTPSGNGSPEMRFAVLKGLGHVYPKGRAKQDNGIVAAEIFWEFFKTHKR